GGFEILQDSHYDSVFAGLAVVQKISWGKETGSRLHFAVLPVDGIFRGRVASRALRRHRQREVSTSATTGDSQPLRVDAVTCGIVPDKPHRPVNVLGDLRNCELGLRAVYDGKNNIPTVQKWSVELRIDRFVARE